MKYFNTKLILIILLIGLFLTGCSKMNLNSFNASEENNTKFSVTIIPDSGSSEPQTDKEATNITEGAKSSEKFSTESVSSASATPTMAAIQPPATTDLPVYTVNVEAGEIVPVIAAVPKNSTITPEFIVNTVVDSMADQSIIIGIKDVTVKGDTVIVNFDKDKTPYNNTGSSIEAAILDAIAQSIIDNLDNYNKVIYRVNDGAYVSGSFELGINEPYLEDN